MAEVRMAWKCPKGNMAQSKQIDFFRNFKWIETLKHRDDSNVLEHERMTKRLKEQKYLKIEHAAYVP